MPDCDFAGDSSADWFALLWAINSLFQDLISEFDPRESSRSESDRLLAPRCPAPFVQPGRDVPVVPSPAAANTSPKRKQTSKSAKKLEDPASEN